VSSEAASNSIFPQTLREACAWIVVSRLWGSPLGELEVRCQAAPPGYGLALNGDLRIH
jgi:hypothetical protein